MSSAIDCKTPSFTGAFTIGDVTYRVIDAKVQSLDWTCNTPTISIDSLHEVPNPWRRMDMIIRLNADNVKVIMEHDEDNIKIRNKLVKDCSVEELLFAIQTKIKKV